MKYILIILFSVSTFASLDCARDKRNTKYSELSWFKASSYNVLSSIKNISGVLCVGFSIDKALKRVHYFDNENNTVFKSFAQLERRDIVFFSRSMMPGVVRSMMKSTHPLTINIKRTKKESVYIVNVKFVENMMKGFNKAKIRLIPMILDYRFSKPSLSYNNNEFDNFKLNVSNSMKVQRLRFYNSSFFVNSHRPSYFKLTRRN